LKGGELKQPDCVSLDTHLKAIYATQYAVHHKYKIWKKESKTTETSGIITASRLLPKINVTDMVFATQRLPKYKLHH
jgi:formate-dependent nitrite reductase cytochrome c552 subunit